MRRISILLVALLLSLGHGCALNAHTVGLVEVEGRRVALRTLEDARFRIWVGEEQPILRGLSNCRLEVDGPRLGRWLVPRAWRVTDAGDGSIPYLGVLRQHGSNLVLDDRDSGMPIIIHQDVAAELTAYVGQAVLIMGYVVGTQEIKVMAYRVLPE